MPHLNIVRAWKDAGYRRSLSAAERALLPEHPAGVVGLTAQELESLAGAQGRSVPVQHAGAQEICPLSAQCGPSIVLWGPGCAFCE
jgi:mersacidin/lichenicidin family type 2 lantibiotic